jgi:hypothetical protein
MDLEELSASGEALAKNMNEIYDPTFLDATIHIFHPSNDLSHTSMSLEKVCSRLSRFGKRIFYFFISSISV